MSIGPRLELRQSQQLVMTPQLQQAIKLLQMSNLELTTHLADEMERNPLLQDAASSEGEAHIAEPSDQAVAADRTLSEDRQERVEETFDTGLENVYADVDATPPRTRDNLAAPGGSGSAPENIANLEEMVAENPTLRDHLLEQIGASKAPQLIARIASVMINDIDDNGWFGDDPGRSAMELGATEDETKVAIALIQQCDPIGVGARSLSECLALQLKDRNRLDPAMQAILDNLPLLASGEHARLMEIAGVDTEDLADALVEIRALDPRPGRRFATGDAPTVTPDVFVRRAPHGGWSVELNTDALPRLLVDKTYAAETGGANQPEVRTFLAECRQNASWLMKSLDQRAQTILKVATEIVLQQDGFLTEGVGALKPLTLKAVADAIGMHESTVSRVTTNKYLATERGVLEMKFFFTTAIQSTEGGGTFSSAAIRHRIKRLIGEESPKSILSDDRIVTILKEDGVDIARRTVAKYREAMDIPSSVQRRRLKNAAVAL